MFIVKKKSKKIKAYCLTEENPVVMDLIAQHKIEKLNDSEYRVWSQEAILAGKSGELAHANDYVKIDSTGSPYPNAREYFLENHIHIQGDEYEQVAKPLHAWNKTLPMCEEVQFLIDHKDLKMTEEGFSAPLWGSVLNAKTDSWILFYSIEKDSAGTIVDASFNFVTKDEFQLTYDILEA